MPDRPGVDGQHSHLDSSAPHAARRKIMGDERERAKTADRRFVVTKRQRHAAAAAHPPHPRAQVCVVDARLCQARTDKDDQAPELTGFYQEKTAARPHFTMQINQAGDHVQVWVLGMFCADELRCLLDQRCSLAVDGYTDPKGSEQSNKDLSEWRAQNVVQAVMEIVGDGRLQAKLGVPEGHGEGPARRELPDRADDPTWRKVNVTLDGSVLLQLHAPRT
jgi:hypothetical protein